VIVNDLDVSRQITLEGEMFRASADRLKAQIAEAKKRGEEDNTPYSSRLMTAKIEAVTAGIAAFVAPFLAGQPTRKAIAIKFIRLLEPEVCAALALKGVLAGITKRRTFQRCASIIGRMVEDELMWRAFEAQAPEQAKITERKLQTASSYRHRRKVAGVMAGRAEVDRVEMTETERLNVGSKLLEIVIETTGMIEMHDAGDGTAASARMYYLIPKPETLDWIERFTSWYAAVSPEWWPTVIPPKPWTGPSEGGYYTRIPRPLTLVKNARKAYLADLEHVDMPDVYAAVNAVQETGYRVDAWVLATMKQVWANNLSIAGLPKRDPAELPAKPADIETNEEARLGWRKAAAKVYADNVKTLSRRVQFDQGVKMAERFAEEPAIYFPHQYDFRGRLYAIPLLSYQGPDWMKGLLRFAEGKPVNDATAAGWLMIQGANLWGADKGTLDERMTWVEEHVDQIAQAGTDPLADYWWAEADKPWQFLQWCREWTLFTQNGYGFVSSFICSADGTCNGLQHFSAMLRDPVGGAAVNLLPGEKPSDIYAKVAEVVTAKLRLIASRRGGAPKEVPPRLASEWAQVWLDFGIDRKTTKRSVMVLPYGGTMYSTREFVEDAIRDRLSGGSVNPFACKVRNGEGVLTDSDGIFAASLFLAPLVWESIGEVVVAARAAMGWLRSAAKLVAQEGLPVTWRTPDGFPVQQAYYDTKQRRVELMMHGTVIKLMIREELPEISKRRQEQGVSPNFVHSCDGTALRQYVVTGLANGINTFAMVHDSFGSLAADYETMQACLRHAFVDLYKDNDVLEQLRTNILPILSAERVVDLPPVPAKGSLDLEQVKNSDFFFA
jgi:DNA-directed RNA polymerase